MTGSSWRRPRRPSAAVDALPTQLAPLYPPVAAEALQVAADFLDLVYVIRLAPSVAFEYISPAVDELIGYSAAEHYADPHLAERILHPDDADAYSIPRGAEFGEIVTFECRWIARDGRVVHTQQRARKARRDDGSVVIYGAVRDVTSIYARQAEHEIQRLRLRATMDAMPDFVMQLEPLRDTTGAIVDFVHVDVNDGAARRVGISRAELTGSRLSDIQPASGDEGLIQMLAHVVESGEPLVADGVPFPDATHGGELRLVDLRANRVGTGVTFLVRDVTERERGAEALAESEAQLRLLAENATDIVLQTDRGIIRWVSPSCEELLGWTATEIVGRPLIDLWYADDFGQARVAHDDFWETGRRLDRIGRVATASGGYRWMAVRVQPVRDAQGELTGAVLGARDVHEETLARSAQRESESLFRSLLESSAIGIAMTDLHGNFRLVNPTLCSLVGREESWIYQHRVDDILVPTESDRADHVAHDLAAGRIASFRGHFELQREDGSSLWTRVSAVLLRDSAGEPSGLMLQVEDVSAERDAQEALEYQAFHDALTGLRNRAWIVDLLDVDLESAERTQSKVGVFLIDLDNFKVINESLSHAAGDQVIREVASRISEAVGLNDRIGRFGGDEFVVVVPDLRSIADVERMAEQISTAISQEFEVEGHRLRPTASIGVAVSTPVSTAASMLRDTDVALYRAKKAGRARWHFADETMHAQAVSRLIVESEIREGLEHGQFVAYYQPIVSLPDGAVIGHEALARWKHPERGLLAPGAFLDAAEESGLIAGIGQAMLEQVCELISAHPEVPGAISINVSAVQLATRGWSDDVMRVINFYGIDPRRIVVEVTETAVLSAIDEASLDLEALRRLGIGVHVDDFGTGYSSIALLRDLPVTGIKLDRSFVSNLTPGESSANALAAGVAGLAEGLHLRGIAEGIETHEQVHLLVSLGWHVGQGYLFGRPAPEPISGIALPTS